ncbi:MAG: hypothetical protein M3Z29_15475 [Pseudomonadota bacterium]|nr:hypothetical protein [Pseudomonadota bacterium]
MMRARLPHLALVLAVASVAGSLGGQSAAASIYRCGQEYSGAACPGGRAIQVDSNVSAARRAEALGTADSEHRLAEQMARERRAEAAALHPAMATSLGPARPVLETVSAVHKRKAKTRKRSVLQDEHDDFIARVPKKKAANKAAPA